jgi:hypothetical protein
MLQRCHSENDRDYRHYGARGIRVCDRWRFGENGMTGVECFVADMGPRPAKHSIERIDNNGNYEPGNCRWATQKEQVRNTRASRMLTFNGETMCLAAWAERLGIPQKRISDRLGRMWSVERALTVTKLR